MHIPQALSLDQNNVTLCLTVFPLFRLLYVVLLVDLICVSQFVRQESPPA